jgi:hypothetical protein
MRNILTVIFLLIAGAVFAQKIPETAIYRVRIYESDKTILAEITPVKSPPRAKAGLDYYWYGANIIHATPGGYSGKLLNGRYTEFYPDKSLKAQGAFKKGLKTGVWKTWNADGALGQVTNWKKGVMTTEGPFSLWKKIKLFIRKI